MQTVAQEIAQYQAEFTALLAEWNRLPTRTRRREWDRFTQAVDRGGAGWTRYALLLDAAWCEGFDPLGGMRLDAEAGLVPAAAPS